MKKTKRTALLREFNPSVNEVILVAEANATLDGHVCGIDKRRSSERSSSNIVAMV